jgi:16S rRNA (uracil1498-N3)-methyltransferase
MVKVLRIAAGEVVMLADGQGREVKAEISEILKESLIALPCGMPAKTEQADSTEITLYQGLPKGDKIDLILQKVTELGVDRIVIFAADRSVPRIEQAKEESRLLRWQKIISEASRQSCRETIPEVTYARSLADALRPGGHAINLLVWEDEKNQRLKELLNRPAPASIGFIIGPEGGLTKAEAGVAQSAGYQPVSLGKRILRTETAGLALMAILQYQWGDL